MRLAFQSIPKEFVSKTDLLDYRTAVTEALDSIKRYGAVVVMRDGKYYGLVDSRTIERTGRVKLQSSYQIGKLSTAVQCLYEEYDIAKAAEIFYNSEVKALPFVSGNRITGVVKRIEILKALLSIHALSQHNVGEAASVPLYSVDYKESVALAKEQMRKRGINRLPVTASGKLYGILTHRSLMQYSMTTNERAGKLSSHVSMSDTTVGEICDRDVYSVDYHSNVDEALRQIIKGDVSALLVTRNGKPYGMVSARDILELFLKNTRQVRSRVFISGLDERTKEYEPDIFAAFDELAEKIGRFSRVHPEFIYVNVKSMKARHYEVTARIGLSRIGVIALNQVDFTLDSAINKLTHRLYNEVKDRKELITEGRKV